MATASATSTIVYRRSSSDNSVEYPVSPIQANLAFRASLLKRAEADPLFAKSLFDLCKRDIIFWIDNFCWTKDPRRDPAVLPFICYDFQVPFILRLKKSIREGGDEGIEKSRDMGASWGALYGGEHEFQFEEGSDGRIGSRKEDFVDKLGVIDTLIEKIRFNLSRQPLFLLPAGLQTEKGMKDNTPYMRLTNKANGNSIIGESANAHFGSGGRSRWMILDEFAKWEKGIDEQAWTSTADVTRCRIVLSTPVGSGNKFARLMKGSEEKIHRITLHWTMHPDKSAGSYYLSSGTKIAIDLSKDPNAAFKVWEKHGREPGIVRSPWYDMEAERRSEADLAQEVDIDYHRSGAMFFSSRALASQKPWVFMRRKNPEGPIPYGFYIRGKLTSVKDTVKMMECDDGWLRIYELPQALHQYACGADSSEGLPKGDKSSMVITDKTTGHTVATINYLKAPEDFASDVALACWYFNEADCGPENNNHGYTTARELEGKSHVKLYYTKVEETIDGVLKETPKRGFTTDRRTRPLILDNLAHLIDKCAVELRDQELIEQCGTFIRNADRGGRPEADGEFKDDLIFARAIADFISEEIPFQNASPKSNTAQREAVDGRRKTHNGGFGFGK